MKVLYFLGFVAFLALFVGFSNWKNNRANVEPSTSSDCSPPNTNQEMFKRKTKKDVWT